MPTAIIRPRPTAGLWSPIPGIWLAIASLRRAARLLFDRCATAPETRPLAVSRAHPSRVQRRPTGGGGDSPARRPGADGRCASPVTLPRTPPAVLGVLLPTMLNVCRRRWGPIIGRERRRVRPVTPPSRPRRRSNSDHVGKSSYSGEIDYRFLTFQTGYQFSGSRLTSLVKRCVGVCPSNPRCFRTIHCNPQ